MIHTRLLSDVVVCRRAVRRPLLRHELLSLLNVFDNLSVCNGNGGCISSSPSRHSVSVMHSSIVRDLFGVDKSSLALFNSLGGILLRTEYAALFALRHRILCDTSFWSFWDVVVMQSGWSLLDVKVFNDMYNNGLYSFMCIVRDSPSKCVTSSSWICAPLTSIGLDSLCFMDHVYDGLYDLCLLLLHKSTIVGLFGSSKRWSLQYTDLQVRCFKYQLQLVKRMVDVRSPVADIISFCMDINALIDCLSPSLTRDSDFCNTSYVAALLDMEVMSFVHSSQHFHKVKKLVSIVDSNIW